MKRVSNQKKTDMKKPCFTTIRVILAAAISISMYACGEGPKDRRTQIPVQQEAEMSGIGVYLNVVVPRDDVFEVYYFQQGQDGFSPGDYVSKNIKGSPMPQDVFFELPEGVYPERLRLDFGKREDQGPMKLASIGLFYNQKEYVFTKSEILKGFKPSKFMDLDTDDLTLTTRAIDSRYDPYLYSMRVSNIVNYLLED